MATFDDVVKELIKKTESGDLEWKADRTHWSVSYDACTFMVAVSGELQFHNPSNGWMPLGNADKDLADLLAAKFPYDWSLDEALGEALECLQGHSTD